MLLLLNVSYAISIIPGIQDAVMAMVLVEYPAQSYIHKFSILVRHIIVWGIGGACF